MNIYYIVHNDGCNYDSYDSHVIVATSKSEVIDMSKHISADEGANVWSNATIKVVSKYTGRRKRPFILLSSFNAG